MFLRPEQNQSPAGVKSASYEALATHPCYSPLKGASVMAQVMMMMIMTMTMMILMVQIERRGTVIKQGGWRGDDR